MARVHTINHLIKGYIGLNFVTTCYFKATFTTIKDTEIYIPVCCYVLSFKIKFACA